MAPGDREWRTAARRRETGLEIDDKTLKSLGDFAGEHGVTALRTLSAGT